MNWSLEQTVAQLRNWKAGPKQRLYVVFTWDDVRVSSVCSVSELNEDDAVVVLELEAVAEFGCLLKTRQSLSFHRLRKRLSTFAPYPRNGFHVRYPFRLVSHLPNAS